MAEMLFNEHIDCFQLVFWGYAGDVDIGQLPRFFLPKRSRALALVETSSNLLHTTSFFNKQFFLLAQISWLYASPTSKRYKIGLYHGDRTRHVLLYINNKITIIDFAVKQDKTYSFFIEEELCELSLQKQEKFWSYDFTINTEVQTPANRQRRKRELRYLIYAIAFLILFIIIVVLTNIFIF